MIKTFVSIAMFSLLAACAQGGNGAHCCSKHASSCEQCCKGHCKECCHEGAGGHCPHEPK